MKERIILIAGVVLLMILLYLAFEFVLKNYLKTDKIIQTERKQIEAKKEEEKKEEIKKDEKIIIKEE